MGRSVYLGFISASPGVIDKIRAKHNITLEEVREALQWPAKAQVAEENDEEHGRRWAAVGSTGQGRLVIAALLPEPPRLGSDADTWMLKTARWV